MNSTARRVANVHKSMAMNQNIGMYIFVDLQSK